MATGDYWIGNWQLATCNLQLSRALNHRAAALTVAVSGQPVATAAATAAATCCCSLSRVSWLSESPATTATTFSNLQSQSQTSCSCVDGFVPLVAACSLAHLLAWLTLTPTKPADHDRKKGSNAFSRTKTLENIDHLFRPAVVDFVLNESQATTGGWLPFGGGWRLIDCRGESFLFQLNNCNRQERDDILVYLICFAILASSWNCAKIFESTRRE